MWDFWLDRAGELYRLLSLPVRWGMRGCKKLLKRQKTSFIFGRNTLQYYGFIGIGYPGAKEAGLMAKKAAGAAKKRSGSLSVHLVLLLVLAVLGWRLYVQQGENEKARAEHDAYAQQVETLKQDNEALRADIAEGATDEKMEELARNELGWTDSNEYVFYDKSN